MTDDTLKKIDKIINHKNNLKTGSLYHIAEEMLSKNDRISNLAKKHKTPFYVFDNKNLDRAINSFCNAFKERLPKFKPYYAMKINHHNFILKQVTDRGFGLDVASLREVDLALKSGCRDMVYFSPGKTNNDLIKLIKYSNIITINIDSFNELKKIGELTKKYNRKIKVGIRVHTNKYGAWKKYGINLSDLHKFWLEANKFPHIDLRGIHFHSSRHGDSSFYENTIKEIGEYLKKNFSSEDLTRLKFFDFGGGFEVSNSEGIYPWKTTKGSILSIAHQKADVKDLFKEKFFIRKASSINEYAEKISNAILKYIEPLNAGKITYYTEPGRYICNNAMHIVLSIADIKNDKNIILDGGVNMVGWQRYEYEYFPLINISNPSKVEKKCNIWGNLCTTWDIWGYHCYASKFEEDDLIVVPNQGALTYSLAQNFINKIPNVYKLS